MSHRVHPLPLYYPSSPFPLGVPVRWEGSTLRRTLGRECLWTYSSPKTRRSGVPPLEGIPSRIETHPPWSSSTDYGQPRLPTPEFHPGPPPSLSRPSVTTPLPPFFTLLSFCLHPLSRTLPPTLSTSTLSLNNPSSFSLYG